MEETLELSLVHPGRSFNATRLVELAAPKVERRPLPAAPQPRRPINVSRLKELAEPQLRRRPEKAVELPRGRIYNWME